VCAREFALVRPIMPASRKQSRRSVTKKGTRLDLGMRCVPFNRHGCPSLKKVKTVVAFYCSDWYCTKRSENWYDAVARRRRENSQQSSRPGGTLERVPPGRLFFWSLTGRTPPISIATSEAPLARRRTRPLPQGGPAAVQHPYQQLFRDPPGTRHHDSRLREVRGCGPGNLPRAGAAGGGGTRT
jgi:hypothetical protein